MVSRRAIRQAMTVFILLSKRKGSVITKENSRPLDARTYSYSNLKAHTDYRRPLNLRNLVQKVIQLPPNIIHEQIMIIFSLKRKIFEKYIHPIDNNGTN